MAVALLPGAHLYIQVLRNSDPDDCARFRQPFPAPRIMTPENGKAHQMAGFKDLYI